jgi:hypothetical protein
MRGLDYPLVQRNPYTTRVGPTMGVELVELPGAVMGAVGGLATQMRLGADGRPPGRAGALAASMWVGGVGGPAGLRGRRGQRRGPGDRPVLNRASHHRFGSLGDGAGDDGPRRRANPAGNDLTARTPTDRRPGGYRGAHPGGASVPDLGSRPAAGGSYKPAPVRVAVTASGRHCGRLAWSSCEGLGDDWVMHERTPRSKVGTPVRIRSVVAGGYRFTFRIRSAWGRGPMRIKARVTQIWVFCVPALVSVSSASGMGPVEGFSAMSMGPPGRQ